MASKVWKLLWVADNQIDNNRKMQSLPPYKISSTNRQKECYAGRCCGEHKMVLRYAFCKAQECGSKCPVCYRHIFCDSKQKWYLYLIKKKQYFMFTNLLTKLSTAENPVKA